MSNFEFISCSYFNGIRVLWLVITVTHLCGRSGGSRWLTYVPQWGWWSCAMLCNCMQIGSNHMLAHMHKLGMCVCGDVQADTANYNSDNHTNKFSIPSLTPGWREGGLVSQRFQCCFSLDTHTTFAFEFSLYCYNMPPAPHTPHRAYASALISPCAARNFPGLCVCLWFCLLSDSSLFGKQTHYYSIRALRVASFFVCVRLRRVRNVSAH